MRLLTGDGNETAFQEPDERESGQDLIEYALIAALIALGAIVAMGSLSNKISNEFNSVGNSL